MNKLFLFALVSSSLALQVFQTITEIFDFLPVIQVERWFSLPPHYDMLWKGENVINKEIVKASNRSDIEDGHFCWFDFYIHNQHRGTDWSAISERLLFVLIRVSKKVIRPIRPDFFRIIIAYIFGAINVVKITISSTNIARHAKNALKVMMIREYVSEN